MGRKKLDPARMKGCQRERERKRERKREKERTRVHGPSRRRTTKNVERESFLLSPGSSFFFFPSPSFFLSLPLSSFLLPHFFSLAFFSPQTRQVYELRRSEKEGTSHKKIEGKKKRRKRKEREERKVKERERGKGKRERGKGERERKEREKEKRFIFIFSRTSSGLLLSVSL